METTSRRGHIGIVAGGDALGVHDTELSAARLAKLLLDAGESPVSVELDQPSTLTELWNYRAIILLSDGSYPEAGNALTLAALREWTYGGGVLACVGASPFLLAAKRGGVLYPSVRSAIDILGITIGNNAAEQALATTEHTPVAIKALAETAALTDLNHGATRLLTLHAIPGASRSLLETARGDTIFGTYPLGSGWLVNWGSAVQGQWRGPILDSVASEVLSLASGCPARPNVIVDPLVCDLTTTQSTISVLLAQPVAAELRVENVLVQLNESSVHSLHATIPALDAPEDFELTHGTESIRGVLLPPTRVPIPTGEPSPRPADFDQFWADSLRELSSIPRRLDYGETLLADATMTIQRVTFRSAGWLTISGLLARPTEAQGDLPAVLSLPGYSASGLESLPLGLVAKGVVALTLDVRGVGSPEFGYLAEHEGILTHRLDNPKAAGMRGVVLDCIRALDHLCEEPGIDLGRIGVSGGSQGGALAIMVGALDRRVRAIASAVPFLCNIAGSFEAVPTEPYAELRRYLHNQPHMRSVVLQTLSYFDAIHFASRITQPTLVTYADNDDIAPSAGAKTLIKNLHQVVERQSYEGHISPALASEAAAIEGWLFERLNSHLWISTTD